MKTIIIFLWKNNLKLREAMGNSGSSSDYSSSSDSGNSYVSSSGSSNVSISGGGSVSLGGYDRSDRYDTAAYDSRTASTYGEACALGANAAVRTFVEKDMSSGSDPMTNNVGTDFIEKSSAAIGGCIGAVARKAFSD